MVDVRPEDLRALSQRAKRAHALGAWSILAGMLLFPAQMALAARWPGLATFLALAGLALVGALFVRYAFVSGQARGEFRRVFRELHQQRRAAVKAATAASSSAAREPAEPTVVAQ